MATYFAILEKEGQFSIVDAMQSTDMIAQGYKVVDFDPAKLSITKMDDGGSEPAPEPTPVEPAPEVPVEQPPAEPPAEQPPAEEIPPTPPIEEQPGADTGVPGVIEPPVEQPPAEPPAEDTLPPEPSPDVPVEPPVEVPPEAGGGDSGEPVLGDPLAALPDIPPEAISSYYDSYFRILMQ